MSRLTDLLATIEPKRVCIIKPSSMGDVVHAMPILSALRGRWPSAHFCWVVNRPFQDLLQGHRDLDELIVYDRGKKGLDLSGIASMAGLMGRLRRGRYDLTIDLQGLFRSAMMVAAAGSRVRVGLADAREGARWFYSHHVDAPRLGMHAVDRALRVARAFGAAAGEPHYNLPIGPGDRQWAAERLAPLPRPRIILNLGAQWQTKRWPPEHFAAVARRAFDELGAGLIAVGSTGDRSLVDELKRRLDPIPVLDLSGQTTLPQLAAVCLECDLMVSNDTGPLHLAVAAGARAVGIYTCTDPALTGPYGPLAISVRTGVHCAASFLKSCGRLDCMSELQPNRVWPAVLTQLPATRRPD